jgi:hypothetical protein
MLPPVLSRLGLNVLIYSIAPKPPSAIEAA